MQQYHILFHRLHIVQLYTIKAKKARFPSQLDYLDYMQEENKPNLITLFFYCSKHQDLHNIYQDKNITIYLVATIFQYCGKLTHHD